MQYGTTEFLFVATSRKLFDVSGIAMFMYGGPMCDVWGSCVRDVYLEGLCAGKASVYLSKRINSSLLTTIYLLA